MSEEDKKEIEEQKVVEEQKVNEEEKKAVEEEAKVVEENKEEEEKKVEEPPLQNEQKEEEKKDTKPEENINKEENKPIEEEQKQSVEENKEAGEEDIEKKKVDNVHNAYENVKKSLEEERDLFISEIEKFQGGIKEKYEHFFQKLDEYALDSEGKIPEEDKKGFLSFKKKFDSILKLQKTLSTVIGRNLELLNMFLSKNEYLYEKYPNQSFVNGNLKLVLESWTMSEIEFKNLGLKSIFEDKNLNKNLKKIINHNIIDEKDLFEISDPTLCTTEKSKLESGSDIFQKMKFSGLKNENFQKLFQEIPPDTNFTELRKIRLKRCILDSFHLKGKFPSLEVIKASNSIFRLEKQPIELISLLKTLTLKNCSLTNNSCSTLLNLLSTSDAKKSLENLNLQNNKITKIEFDFEQLPNLKELNLENNKLYKLGQFKTPECSLKLLNIIGNNYAFYENFSDLIEQKNQKNKFIVLCSKNLIAFQDDFKKKYLEKLKQNLKNIEYAISFLSFEMLFNKFDSGNILSLEFNPKIEEGLNYLNLSYCGLTDDLMAEFLGKTKLANLRKLNLSSNLLTDKFASDLCNLKNPFFNLKKIILTNNEKIEGQGFLLNYLHFFEKHHLLKEMHIYRTKFEENFISFCNPKKKDGAQVNFAIPEDATEEMLNTSLNCFVEKFNTMFQNRNLKIMVKSIFHAPNQMKEFSTKFARVAKVFQFKMSKKNLE
ncbi:MAG: leucine-rich repeat domain-containing protein [archaeon]|nr:leucine-rich repeat domain-containing protein [archaeon]